MTDRGLSLLLTLVSCGGSAGAPLISKQARALPKAEVVALDAIPRETLCAGRLVVEIDHLIVRRYPRASLTPPFHYLPLVAGVLTVPGGPDEGDVTLVAGKQVYRPGDYVRVFEGRVLLDRPIYRLQGLEFAVHLAENHNTVMPLWMMYTNVASEAAQALPGPTSGVIDVSAQIFRKLDKDDIMLTWATRVDDLVALARTAGQLHYRLLTPALLPDGSHAADLDLVIRIRPEPSGCD